MVEDKHRQPENRNLGTHPMIDYAAIGNLPEAFFDNAAKRAGEPFLGAKRDGQWQTMDWGTVATQVSELSRGLRALGLQRGDRVAIVSENRPEWAIADLAVMSAGGISVPAYTTNTVDDHLHILSDSGAKMAIVSTERLAKRLIPAVKRALDTDTVIAMDPVTAGEQGVRIVPWQDALERGRALPDDVAERIADTARSDTSCIIYTSGTGGRPKGVMLSHGAILCNCHGAYDLLRTIPGFQVGGETFLSFLPLSHSYEHTAGLMFPITIGARIYYAEGVDRLVNNMAEVSPTIMTAVPRLYEAIHGRILRGVEQAGGFKEKLFHSAVTVGRRRLEKGSLPFFARLQDRVLDRLVREKVRQRFGGRLKAFVSGGAPLNPEIGSFFLALGVRILQGYGQTESAPVVSCNPATGIRIETVGPPVTGVEVKIAPDGEILVRGELVMQGYWRNPEATADALRDGWLHTGDIGVIDPDGYIRITDRKKDIIVNSGGDNLSPQKVEGILTIEPEIAQAMVFGDRRPHLVALLVAEEGCEDGLGMAVSRVNDKLSNIEKIRRFVVADEPFTTENGMMTPSMKIRRHVIVEKYRAKLEALYAH
jgi:long-chain acyl-CoA synthetase